MGTLRYPKGMRTDLQYHNYKNASSNSYTPTENTRAREHLLGRRCGALISALMGSVLISICIGRRLACFSQQCAAGCHSESGVVDLCRCKSRAGPNAAETFDL